MFEDIKTKEAQEDPTRFAKIKPVKRKHGSEANDVMAVTSEIDELLRKAIQERRLIELVYNGKRRILEPHDYGIHKGSEKLLGYQVGGSSSGQLPNWRWMEIERISDVHLLESRFRGGRPPSSGRHHQWDRLYLRVEPSNDHEGE